MGGGAAGVDRRGPRVRILLVDEDSKDLQLYRSVLQEQGHVVDCCATFPEAGERLERAWYDLIIFSEEGRTFNGQALLERAIELNRYRPVLVLTRFVDRRTYVDAIYLGALDYIEKPLAPLEIIRMVKNGLSYFLAPAGVRYGCPSSSEG
jgi:DNA-binding response OmpR family regulator